MIDPNKLRRKVLDMVYDKKSGHIGGSYSIAELISVLYNNYDIGGRDKLILSKGHAVPIVYAALHELGRISDKDISLFREVDSPLQGHPDKNRLPELDATTGSLGQGLSIAIGHALAKKHKKQQGLIFCILGDGEIQEGQIWEALLSAPKFNLDNLICVIDWNKGQSEGWSNDSMPIYNNLLDKIKTFGWDCHLVDGHDMSVLKETIDLNSKLPKCIIMNTIKGKGVSFMESPSWHAKCPSDEEYELAKKELEI